MKLSWHDVLVHNCLSFKVVIFHVSLSAFLVSVVVTLITVLVAFIESVLLKVLSMFSFMRIGWRMHVKALVIVLAAHSVVPVFVEVIAQRVVIALIFKDIESIVIISASLNSFDLLLSELEA